MDAVISTAISAGLFYAFVPGVFITLPKGGNRTTVLVVHAILFAIVASIVMTLYWNMREGMTNYGPVCPNGYVIGLNQEGVKDCIPSGKSTYPVNTGNGVNIPSPNNK